MEDINPPENKTRNQSRQILIIGGAGYIGTVLTKKLLDQGFRVRILDKLIYNNGCTLYSFLENNNFSFIHGDFGNSKTLDKALENISDVVLLAALVGDPICKKYPELARKTNGDYPRNLVKQINDRNIGNFIFTSTCSNYGLRNDNTPADEESALNPLSLYAESKVGFEQFLQENMNNFDFTPTILRLSTAFGISYRMRFDLTISEFTRELALGNKLVVYDENTWRPYCNVSDISDAIIKVLQKSKDTIGGQIFNIGCDENNYTKNMIIELIKKYVHNPVIEYKTTGSDPRNYRVSFKKAKNILDLEPGFSAEDSIRNLIEAIRNQLFGNIISRQNFYGNYYINE